MPVVSGSSSRVQAVWQLELITLFLFSEMTVSTTTTIIILT